MEVTETKGTADRMFTFKGLKSKQYGFCLYLSQDTTNCKLSYIHQPSSLNGLNKDEKKEVVDYLLRKAKGCVILNTTYKEITNFIKTTYPTYYYQEVPIGYNGGFQYHICIKNTISVSEYCRQPVKEVQNGLVKKDVKEKLLTILKTKRRKIDYVDEFIKTLD